MAPRAPGFRARQPRAGEHRGWAGGNEVRRHPPSLARSHEGAARGRVLLISGGAPLAPASSGPDTIDRAVAALRRGAPRAFVVDAAGDVVTLAPSGRARLTPLFARHFPGDTLFDRVARAVCEADCLPRKELYESWELARRARRRFRGGRVVDLACGHALVAHLMLILDDTSATALAVDVRLPPSAAKLAGALVRAWPRLDGRVAVAERPIGEVELGPGDVVVSAHACGALTDEVLARAVAASARVVVLPCCHEKATCDAGGLGGWVDAALAIDVTRAARLRASGYAVYTRLIPGEITPKNRLLLAEPAR